ncbi:MAG: hypothetical protein ACD_75C00423G0001 [uncultured bacterium]|nr:MAG: hypothetical protein ACD_75C00423G0001 [uncultured bacterium]
MIGTAKTGHAENCSDKYSDKYSLLVADDNLTNLLCLQQILLANGYEVIAATDGHEALLAAEQKQPDLILLDVMMPGIDGFETCRRLKANPATEDIPVIFVTALSNTKDMVTGLELGGVDYMVKPYRNAEVLARIKTQLKVVVLNRELRRSFDFQEREVNRRTAELEAANRALKEAQREIVKRRQFLEAVLENAPDAIVTLDEVHHVIDWNPGAVRMFGFSPEEAKGKHLDNLVARGGSLAEAGEKTRMVLSGRAVEPFETIRQRRDGTALHVIAGGSPIMIDGLLAGAVAVYTDISAMKRTAQERKEYERRIQQLQKMEAIGTLAGGIAHDFNNILSAVFGYAELSIIRSRGNQVLQRNLNGILEAAKRAKDLVQQILLFSRQGEQELKPLQIRPLIKESLKMLRSSLPTTIKIKQQIEGDLENVLANPTQIHQIIMNLCANAAQAMEEDGGVLTVGLSQVGLTEENVRHHPGRKAGTYLKLRVQDTGRGIPAELLDKIYNPYFTTKAKGQGTGLGLSVVHGIVQSYSGLIEVGSEPGRGTVFDVFLPAIELEAVREELPVIQLPGGSEHILLVDDEAVLIEVLGDMLRLLGYRVTATTSSVGALRMFQASPADFDLLITDMTMPELTGDRLTIEVRAERPDLPVIICTGYNRRLSDNNPETLAVQAILMKPVEHIQFARTVRAVLDGKERTLPVG